jgi:Flp pilus assembly protein TadG
MLKRYLKDTAGNMAIMFSLTASLLILGIGVAIDTSGVMSQKSDLQNFADSAVLAAVASGEDKPNKLKKIVKQSLKLHNVKDWDLDWELVIIDKRVILKIASVYDTQLMGIAGRDKMDVNVLSEAVLPEEIPINIALVLDRTGSMDGANMTALKSASAKLVDAFDAYDSDTRVAVVPFAKYVNVGMGARTETWIDVPADTSTVIPAKPCYMYQPRTCSGGYTTITETRYNDGVPYSHTYDKCNGYSDDGPEVEYCPKDKTVTTEWHGCIGSRDGNKNKQVAYKGKKIPGVMNEWCGEDVLTLTTDMNAVKAKINSLTASGNTYIPAGLITGWRMLDSSKPFDDLSNKEEKRKRALILMTDGKNTLSLRDPYDTTHNGSDEGAANTLTAELCAKIKSKNIDIYAVAYKFDSGDATAKEMVRKCATNSGQFFDAKDPAQLEAAFKEIGKTLFEVRLTR